MIGFGISYGICLWAHAGKQWPLEAETPQPGAVPSVPAELPQPNLSKAFLSDEDLQQLRVALNARKQEDPAKDLERALALNPKSRRRVMALLFNHWAEADPSAAMAWMVKQAPREDRQFLMMEIASVWAAEDAAGLARWFADFYGQPDSSVSFASLGILNLIAARDPVLYAETMRAPCFNTLQSSGAWGNLFPLIPDLAAARQFAAAAAGRIRYARHEPGSSAVNPAGYIGWNALAEASAVRWHLLDDAACSAWLQSLPEDAQTHIRYSMEQSHLQAARAMPADPILPPAPGLSPPPAFDRSTPEMPVSADTSAECYRQWAEWWRDEPQAAETFLQKAVWPEDLKFRARAKAYASPP